MGGWGLGTPRSTYPGEPVHQPNDALAVVSVRENGHHRVRACAAEDRLDHGQLSLYVDLRLYRARRFIRQVQVYLKRGRCQNFACAGGGKGMGGSWRVFDLHFP